MSCRRRDGSVPSRSETPYSQRALEPWSAGARGAGARGHGGEHLPQIPIAEVGLVVLVAGTSKGFRSSGLMPANHTTPRSRMRSRRLAEALLALFIVGPISAHADAGDHTRSDTVGLSPAVNPMAADGGSAAQEILPSGEGCGLGLRSATRAFTPMEPLPSTQAHNDYDQCRPLYGALDSGFSSIEADVWLVDGRLLVGHDRKDTRTGKTLERLYLSPLERRTRRNAGSVYYGWKGSRALDRRQVGGLGHLCRPRRAAASPPPHDDFLHRRQNDHAGRHRNRQRQPGPWRHDSPAVRYAGFEGRLGDLNTAVSTSFMPSVAADWREIFTWDGEAVMPAAEELRLRRLVTKAHAHGCKVRFWGTPDNVGTARGRGLEDAARRGRRPDQHRRCPGTRYVPGELTWWDLVGWRHRSRTREPIENLRVREISERRSCPSTWTRPPGSVSALLETVVRYRPPLRRARPWGAPHPRWSPEMSAVLLPRSPQRPRRPPGR